MFEKYQVIKIWKIVYHFLFSLKYIFKNLIINMPIGDAVKDYFFFPLLWNLFLWSNQVQALVGCNSIGVWGLFWYNDNGEMMEACF